jgi:hypothetical protein
VSQLGLWEALERLYGTLLPNLPCRCLSKVALENVMQEAVAQ